MRRALLLTEQVFKMAHMGSNSLLCAPSAWGVTPTVSLIALLNGYGTNHILHPPHASTSSCCFVPPINQSVLTDNVLMVAAITHTMNVTSAPVVCPPRMAPSIVLKHRKLHPITPYSATAWEDLLRVHGLLLRYPDIPRGLRQGFDLHLPVLASSQVPSNSLLLLQYREAFDSILSCEFSTGRYVGPFTQLELHRALGPFQSSPISIIPKSGKPGKYRIIQNFSFPDPPSLAHPQPSINSTVDSDDFPCTWGTFAMVCTIIRGLPPGSQAATWDVAEAYRTVPLHHSQWPATMVRISDDTFYVDTCTAFGMGPSAGAYGHVADAGVDLLWAQGLGPIVKWVDDHLFF
jgi:hypothetical protein